MGFCQTDRQQQLNCCSLLFLLRTRIVGENEFGREKNGALFGAIKGLFQQSTHNVKARRILNINIKSQRNLYVLLFRNYHITQWVIIHD